MASQYDVVILGSGSFGTALGTVAARNGKRVLLWARRKEQAEEIGKEHRNSRYLPDTELPGNLEATSDLERAVQSSDLILVAIPSKAFRQVVSRAGDFVTADQVLVHATKGLERGSHKRMSEILAEETCVRKLGVLSGPNLAKEVVAGSPAGSLVASRFEEVRRRVQSVYSGSSLRVYSGRDVVGTEIAGAFKNVVALSCGVAHGLGFGQNTVSLLLTRGLAEMARLGVAMGGQLLTFGGLAGVGDLVATGTSRLSRNHQVGERLAKGETLDQILSSMTQVAEGVPTSQAVAEFARNHGLHLPIAEAVYEVLHEGKPVQETIEHLLNLPVGSELAALPAPGPVFREPRSGRP